MKGSFGNWNRLVLASACALWGVGIAHAQDPSSVDIDVLEGPIAGTLEVRLRANGQGFSEVVSGLTFTISWPSSSPAVLGTIVEDCPSGIDIAATPEVTAGASKFRTFNAFGSSYLSEECPGQVLIANMWLRIMTVQVTGDPGCTLFQIVNNAAGQPANTNYFCSLNGLEKTGIIDPQPVRVGACPPDCFGVVDGPDFPGAPCDDLDGCTSNDVYTENCECAGTGQPVGEISGPVQVLGWTSNTFSIPTIAGASYSWDLPDGWSSASTSGPSLTAVVGNNPGTVDLCVNVIAAGCLLSECNSVLLTQSVGIPALDAAMDLWLTVQPNPSNGAFQLIPSGDGTPMTITVYDATGRAVKAAFVAAGTRTTTLDLGDAAAGVYYLLATREGQQRILKLMVDR